MLQLTDQNPDTTGDDIVHRMMLVCMSLLAYISSVQEHSMYLGTVHVVLSGSMRIQSELSKASTPCSVLHY